MIIIRVKQSLSYVVISYHLERDCIKTLVNKELDIRMYIPFDEIETIISCGKEYGIYDFIEREGKDRNGCEG